MKSDDGNDGGDKYYCIYIVLVMTEKINIVYEWWALQDTTFIKDYFHFRIANYLA